MALHEAADPAAAPPGAPERQQTDWLALGAVVYAWTDRRDPAIDRAWWRLQRVRIYRPAVHEQATQRQDAVPAMA